MPFQPHPIANAANDRLDEADGYDVMAQIEIEDCIHPGLREGFVRLPPVGTTMGHRFALQTGRG